MSPRKQQDRENGAKRKLRNFRGDQAGAPDERAMAAAHFSRREFAGRTTRHVNRAIAGAIAKNSSEGARASIQPQMMANPEAIHSLPPDLPFAILPPLAANSGLHPSHPSPT